MRRLCQLSVLGALLVTAPVAIAPAGVDQPTTPAPAAETGIASWYGRWHHGRRTASGDVFDQAKLTAAHRTLPLGSRVRVTNLANGRSVEVRVNDRGPALPGRALDLSRAAAAKLGALEAGLIPVRIRVVSTPGRDGRKP